MKEIKNIFVCQCNSYEHQMSFWYDEEDRILYTEVHLRTWRNVFKRTWYAIKFIFGHKSRFGSWDEFLFKEEDMKTLTEFLNSLNK